MSGPRAVLGGLLAECEAHGIRLAPADGGGLTIDAPQDALTADLLDRLKAHKTELLTMLRPAPIAATEPTPAPIWVRWANGRTERLLYDYAPIGAREWSTDRETWHPIAEYPGAAPAN